MSVPQRYDPPGAVRAQQTHVQVSLPGKQQGRRRSQMQQETAGQAPESDAAESARQAPEEDTAESARQAPEEDTAVIMEEERWQKE